MAGGYSGGVQVNTGNFKYNTGAPNANAIVISLHNGDPGRATIFGYESGVVMPGLTAPARRTAFFVDASSSINGLNVDGKALFEAVVCWTVGGCSGGAARQSELNPAQEEEITFTAAVMPNPNNGIFSMEIGGNYEGSLTVKITSVDGRQIDQFMIEKGGFDYRKKMDLTRLPAGMYFLQLSNQEQQEVIRLWKQ